MVSITIHKAFIIELVGYDLVYHHQVKGIIRSRTNLHKIRGFQSGYVGADIDDGQLAQSGIAKIIVSHCVCLNGIKYPAYRERRTTTYVVPGSLSLDKFISTSD